jgi:hypothetical protein
MPAPVNATAPRCSMRVTAVLNNPGFLAQPNALLRPSLSRRLIRGLGQQEVLDGRQNVHDVALAIDQLNRMLEVVTHDPLQNKEGTISGRRAKEKPRGEAGQGLAQEYSICLTDSHCSVLPDFRAAVPPVSPSLASDTAVTSPLFRSLTSTMLCGFLLLMSRAASIA